MSMKLSILYVVSWNEHKDIKTRTHINWYRCSVMCEQDTTLTCLTGYVNTYIFEFCYSISNSGVSLAKNTVQKLNAWSFMKYVIIRPKISQPKFLITFNYNQDRRYRMKGYNFLNCRQFSLFVILVTHLTIHPFSQLLHHHVSIIIYKLSTDTHLTDAHTQTNICVQIDKQTNSKQIDNIPARFTPLTLLVQSIPCSTFFHAIS